MFGAGNDELNRICFRYSARIKELREEGYNIATVRQKQGYFRYFLIEDTE